MSKRLLPLLNNKGIQSRERLDESILSRWDKTLVASTKDVATIDIFDAIGEDFFGGGFTAKRMSAALRSIGAENDVNVNINSPGGDFFEGATIYNLLAEHKGKVTVNVLGLAASAASIIAMAGDAINISQVGFIMIHNAWSVAIGNAQDLQKTMDVLDALDKSMVDLYAKRTGLDVKDISKMMGAETWLGAQDAVDKGFATEIINIKTNDSQSDKKKSQAMAKRTLEMALSSQGFSRKEREEIFNEAGLRDAAASTVSDSGDGWKALIKTMQDK